MKYLIGALAGLVWGALAALLNGYITKKALDKASDKAMLLSNALRLVVDIAALGSVFLLRNVLPFSFEAALVGTAASMSILMIVFAYKMAAGK
ncbi:MAG TPA: hypothetical protein IAC00_05660 [Candidatus Limivicinus faecipullorum]|nr:hypothetical protein [Candidatus Limivicinus faecipullorum]